MKFKCYDVVEIQGKRYVVGEVISYQEFIVDKKIRYDLNDENYKKELGVSKGAQSWTEYGLMPVNGTDKKWLTIVNGEKEYCTFSETVLRSTPPAGYRLHDKGIERVVAVEGQSVFFIEDWHGGLTDQAQGERIRLSDVHRRRDQAAQAVSKKIRNAARRKEWTRLGLSWGIILFFFGYLFIGDMSWHELRDEVGFPYTMEERIKDSYYYELQGTKDGLMVYTSKQDPNATAIDLIDAVYGKVYTIKQDTKSPEQWIVIYTTKDVSVISVVNGTTYVEVGQLKNLSDSEDRRIATIRNDSEILLRYAYMVELKNKQGRKTLSNIIKD
ncbi:DUF4178 domain-containing protein [Veillonella parvula]|uniref:DUF4178 domain-containing protein n=1 Tax=Veillonella parvula TaxID=29466 RepID=UPI0028FF65BA|nr:DUF4178 domain-containing protein [Veillonella parvula]MDU3191123.1 DUF4178 domain-containing protein [Veillonella parvula]